MRFWKWHALGNSYLLVEERLEPDLARRLCDVRYGIGSDGVVEVVGADGARAEIVIWNPDGSVAEFSGNGSRIAAAWLGARAGTQQVTIGVAGRAYPAAIRDDGTVAMGVGDVEVGETETIELDGERIELTTVSVTSPDRQLTLPQAMRNWLDPHHDLFPRDIIYPPDQSADEVEQQNTAEMTGSQDSAVAAALQAANVPFHTKVSTVAEKSPAEGKLKPGDIVLAVDGQPVTQVPQIPCSQDTITSTPFATSTDAIDWPGGTS